MGKKLAGYFSAGGAASGGSGFGQAAAGLKGSVAASCVIREGKILDGRQTVQALKAWVDSL